jgi:hypothetical protein
MTSPDRTQLPAWSTRSHRAQTWTGDPGGGSRTDSGRCECALAAEAVAAPGTVSRLCIALERNPGGSGKRRLRR